jgi:hypothetical protein
VQNGYRAHKYKRKLVLLKFLEGKRAGPQSWPMMIAVENE